MAVSNQNTGVKRDLSLAETILDCQERIDRTAHESQTTERTSLLWKPNTSTSNAAANDELISFADIEVSHEQDDGRSSWLVKTIKVTVALYMIMMSGFLPLLQFWILIAFLLMFLK